jgi:scyllo-inositol 2-dehydrogenase (NADP+)
VRVAILGYGLAGSVFHAPLVAATDGLDVATIVTSNRDRQDQARREYPDARVVAETSAAFDDADLVVVATPNHTHAPLAREALGHGAAVVVDKPLALSAREARDLVAEADDRLTVFQNRRWDSDQLTLRRLLAAGKLGEVVRHESRFERWRPGGKAGAWREERTPEEGGGVLVDLGAHLIDEALQLHGPATHVYAEIDSRRGGAADDDAFLALRHRAGALSHLRASAFTAAPGPRLRVLGTEGAFVVEAIDGQEDALRSGERPGAGWGAEPRERWGRFVRGDEQEPVPSEPGAWPEFYAGVARWLRGDAPPPVAAADAVRVLEVIEAARRSAAERRVVEV